MSFLESDCREIITKAICGKGRKVTKTTNYVASRNEPTSILGCWVINHQYRARKASNDVVKIQGTYDINVWYAFAENTKTEVLLEKVTYEDDIVLSSKDEASLGLDDEVMTDVLQQPNCVQCKINKAENNIAVDIEREFSVHVIGDTKIKVRVESPDYVVDQR